MLNVYRSDTDEYVLVHEPTRTVVLGDTLDGAYQRLQERLGPEVDAMMAPPPTPAPAPAPARRGALHYGVLIGLALLPFVWLGVLHVSLGGMVVELQRGLVAREELDQAARSEADQQVRSEVDSLSRRVDRLIEDIRRLKHQKTTKAKDDEPSAESPEAETADPQAPEDDAEGDSGEEAEPEPRARRRRLRPVAKAPPAE